jgi:YD repeat-containing protein
MYLRRLVLVFALAGCACVAARHVLAQNPGTCFSNYQFCALCGDPPIPGATCIVEITILSICSAPSPTCTPLAAASESCPTCNKASASQTSPGFASSPVNLATGNTYIEQSDLRIPGLGGGLSLVRTWNSKWPSSQSGSNVGLFGPNWRSTYEERVFLGNDNYMKYSRSDGSFWSFAYDGVHFVVAAPATLAGSAGGTVILKTPTIPAPYSTITFQNGEQRHFDVTTGKLTSIVDRNGSTTTLTYDSISRLVTITDPASRHLTFTYQSPSSLLVTGVSSDVGISISYAYDSQNRLSQVTNQDSTTLNFTYDSLSRITSVTDSNGKVIESHTYDSESRGLTSSRAAGVEAITLSYQNP